MHNRNTRTGIAHPAVSSMAAPLKSVGAATLKREINYLSDHTEIHCYALRNLSPYTGVVQIIELQTGRAFSVDGIHWEIQVLAENISSCWSVPTNNPADKRFYRYASWSQETGLADLIINPVLDIGAMKEKGEDVLKALEQRIGNIPFQQSDRYELWLMDHEDQTPLALLKAQQGEQVSTSNQNQWKATPKQQRNFPSKAFEHEPSDTTSSDHLEQLVRKRSGQQSRTQWFYRDNDGVGIAIPADNDASLVEQKLTEKAFPELLLQEQWHNEQQQQLCRDYLNWMSPHLLTLQHISDTTREHLETAAMKRPEITANLFHLIPKIISNDKLTSIRIQAKLMRSKAGLSN